MDSIPFSALVSLMAGLILLSAFFSGSETALMSINRYRLRHRAREGHRGAILVSRLLDRPDRLIGLILLGNNFVNVSASILAPFVAYHIYPHQTWGVLLLVTVILTLIFLIFAEVTPKTLAALHPELVAYPAAYIYTVLLKIMLPVVLMVIIITNSILRLFGVKEQQLAGFSLSREEFSTVVKEAGAMLHQRHRSMLLNVLELEETTVEDIMVPRNEVVGIDLDDDWDEILEQLQHAKHTRIPIFRESVDNIIGILHVKRVVRLITDENFDKAVLEGTMADPYFIPEGTPLTKQLMNFQQRKRRIALVVDEYGDLLGLVTLEDILEEIVGEFTTDIPANIKDIHRQEDGSFLVDGGVHIRDINRALSWSLPTNGPKTINGMILEHMEMIPEPGTSLLLHGLPVEITKTQKNAVKMAKLFPNKAQREPAIDPESTKKLISAEK